MGTGGVTLVKHRLPAKEVFERYAPGVRYRLIKGYHRKLTERHRWFVRSLDDYFYCDGDRPEIPGVEIFDCDWNPEEWNTRPYRYFYNPVQKALYTSYAREGLPPLSEYDYGYTQEDSKVLRDGEPYFLYFRIGGRMSAAWSPLDEGSPLRVMYNGIITRSNGDEITQGIFTHEKPTDKPADNVLIPVIREINKEKYRGVYDGMAQEIIDRFGVPVNAI